MAELEAEKEKTRSEVADYLRAFCDELDDRGELTRAEDADVGQVTIIVDNESATINPPDSLHFEVEVETDSSLLDTGADRGVTFSLRWDAEQVEASEGMEIE